LNTLYISSEFLKQRKEKRASHHISNVKVLEHPLDLPYFFEKNKNKKCKNQKFKNAKIENAKIKGSRGRRVLSTHPPFARQREVPSLK